MRRALTLIFGIAISLALLVYFFKDVDPALFRSEFHRLQLWVIPPLMIIFVVSLYLRALRWRLLLSAEHRTELNTRDLFDASLVGFAASAVLPLRAGEVIRPLVLRKLAGVPFTAGFASIFTERVFDLTALLAMAWLALSQFKEAPEFILTTSHALGSVAILGIGGLLACGLAGKWTFRLAQNILPRFLPAALCSKLLELLHQIIGVLSALRSFKEIGLVVFYSFAIWGCLALYYQISLSLLSEHASFLTGMLLASTVAFAVAAPSSPGFIGTFQFGCALTLTNLRGYPEEFSLAYSLTIHFIQTITLVILAALIIWKRGIGIRGMVTPGGPPESVPALASDLL